MYIAADITNMESLRVAFTQIQKTLPPIGGVANGTLVLKDRGLVNMDLETFHANTTCKVEGSENLDRLFFTDESLDWFVCFSSTAATTGNMGQMAYTAANMFMKALVHQRRKRGLSASVIDISQVIGVGYVERVIKSQSRSARGALMDLKKSWGSLSTSEPDLHQLFAEAIIYGRRGSNLDSEVIFGIRPMRIEDNRENPWENQARLSHYKRRAVLVDGPVGDKTTSIPLREKLAGTKDSSEIVSIIRTDFKAKLRNLLQIDEDEISEDAPLNNIGVDSLVAVEIRTWFNEQVGVDVAVMTLLAGPSINDLIERTMTQILAQEQSTVSSKRDSGVDFRVDSPRKAGSVASGELFLVQASLTFKYRHVSFKLFTLNLKRLFVITNSL